MVRRGSIGDSGSDTTYGGGGSDTDAGSGVTGDDDDDDTSYGGGGDTSTSAPTGSTGSDDPTSGGSDDDDDSGVVGGGGSRTGGDDDTTYSGGGSDTDAGSGLTGGGSDTTYSGGGGDETTTRTGSGVTGDDSGGAATDSGGTQTPGDADSDRLDDADRGFSATRPGTPGDGGQLERSERAREAARDEETLSGGLEEEYGSLTGEEGRTADAVQQLQGQIDREVPGVSISDTDQYNIVRTGENQLGVEFADGAFGGTRTRREQRQEVARNVASRREGVDPEDVTVTSTAEGFQAILGGGGGSEAVITGEPYEPPAEPELVEGDTEYRGLGVTRGPEGTEVVTPEGGRADPAQPADPRDVTPFSQAQRDATAGGEPAPGMTRTARNRLGVGIQGDEASEDRPPLVEPAQNYSAVEIATGQAGGRRFEQSLINDALGVAGLDEELGFREPTAAQVDPDPRGDSPLRYSRGAGPRRAYSVEAETVGDAVRDEVTDEDVLGAAALGVAAPEPSTTAAGAAVLGTAAAIGASQQQRDGPTAAFGEVEVPDDPQRSELDTPTDSGAVTELDVPDGTDTLSPTELGVPQEAFEPGENGELPVDVSGGGQINEDGEIELPAETSGVVVYRNRDEEEEEDEDEDDEADDEDDEEAEEEEEIVVEVPDEFVPDDDVTIGGESGTAEEEQPVTTPPIQGQGEAEPEEEQADEEFDRDLFAPRQGQLSDDAEPDDTRADEDDPLGSTDNVVGFEEAPATDSDSDFFGSIVGGPPSVPAIGAAGDADREGMSARPDTAPDTGVEEAAALGSDAGTRTDTRIDSDVTDTITDLDMGLSLGAADAVSEATTSQSLTQQLQQGQPTQTTPTTQESVTDPFQNPTRPQDGTRPPRQPRLPSFDIGGGGGGPAVGFESESDTFASEIVGDPFDVDEDDFRSSGSDSGFGGASGSEASFNIDEGGFGGFGSGGFDVGDPFDVDETDFR